MSTDTPIMTDDELKDAIRAATEDHLRAARAKEAALAVLSSLQEESSRRKAARQADDYEAMRRRAAMNGSAPPPPPKSLSTAPVRAATARLAGLSPTLGSRPTTEVPVGVATRVQEDRSDVGETVVRGVSDHAVVRYLERVMGFDIDALRARIMTPTIERAIRSGVARVRIPEGVVVVREGIITSFLPSENGPSRRKGRYLDRGRTPPRPRSEDPSRMANWYPEAD
jgi:hypothetical protein